MPDRFDGPTPEPGAPEARDQVTIMERFNRDVAAATKRNRSWRRPRNVRTTRFRSTHREPAVNL